ncbi:pitrilysin family protein [Brevundimonas sp.]|uniref:M16 family metallopeptidase n=1 Tax=Brevundimonas sp. TaxID=1871086 RepID=UPI0025E8ADE3|nr:pitrilysin family protein [Brevundimonas sp.]
MTAQHVLASGLKVVCDPMPGLRTLAVTVSVEGGARWEDEARSGWSHLLEHLVFKGAGGRDARALIERIENAGGSLNADTGQERTGFHARVLEGDLELALSSLSDLIFRPTLDPVEIEREKDVIAQEIAEAFDTPDDCVFDLAQGQAFSGQPLGRPILGSNASLARADREAVRAWRARLYAPERMVVSVSGAVDEGELLRLAERWFGAPGSGGEGRPEPASFVGGSARDARRIEQANLVFQLPGLSSADPDTPALALLVEILGGGMASRLFQEAREQRGLAYAVDAGFETFADLGLVNVFAGTAPDKAGDMASLAGEAFARLADGVTEAELSRARAQALAGLYMAQESPAQRAERHAFQALTWGRPIPIEESAAKVRAVATADLKRVARRLLQLGRSAAAVVGPKSACAAPEDFARSLFGKAAA